MKSLKNLELESFRKEVNKNILNFVKSHCKMLYKKTAQHFA